MCQEVHSDADQDRRSPAPAVNILLEEKLGGDGVRDQRKGRRGRRHKAQIQMIEGQQQREKRQGQKTDAGEEKRAGHNGANGAFYSRASANLIEIANGFHGRGSEDFAGRRTEYDGGNHASSHPRSGLRGWVGNCHRMLSSFNSATCAGSSSSALSVTDLSVSDGPWATKPTPTVMRTMPAQRSSEIGSWSQKRDRSATITLPKAVAGRTKVRSAHDSAVR